MALNKKGNYIPEVGFLGLLALTISFAGLKLPMFFVLSLILSPIPIVIITFKYKELASFIVSLTNLIILSLFFGISSGLAEFLCFCLVGITVGYSIRNKFSLKKSVILGGASFAVFFILLDLSYRIFFKVGIIQYFIVDNVIKFFEGSKNSFIQNYALIIDYFKLQNLTPESMYMEARNNLNLLLLQIPGFVVCMSWIISFIVIKLSVFILKKTGYKTDFIEPFSYLKLPFSLGLIFVITQFTWDGKMLSENFDRWTVILFNLSMVLGFCCMLQGLALIDFWFNKLGLKGILKVIVYLFAVIIIFPIALIVNLPALLIFVGIMDYLMDFRKLEIKKQSS